MVDIILVMEELKKIIGLPLKKAGRACDLTWFGFGELIKKNDKRHGASEVAEYALHVQCAWRLTDFEKILVASTDMYIPNSKIKYNHDFDWDVQGANRVDEQLEALFSRLKTELTVKNVTVNKFGDIKIFLSDNILLEAFLDSSTDDEAWRFFRRGVDTEHLVATGIGFDWE
jgi:hypothetical protein